jgi:hypothetical protein
VVIGHTITPEALAMHRAEVARLEEQLEEERRVGRAARIEVKHLKAAIADKGMTDFTASTEISDNLSEISGSEYQQSDLEPDTRYVMPSLVKSISIRWGEASVFYIVAFQFCGM